MTYTTTTHVKSQKNKTSASSESYNFHHFHHETKKNLKQNINQIIIPKSNKNNKQNQNFSETPKSNMENLKTPCFFFYFFFLYNPLFISPQTKPHHSKTHFTSLSLVFSATKQIHTYRKREREVPSYRA